MTNYKDFTIKVAREAGKFLMDNYGRIQSLDYRNRTDLKTEIDKRNDKLIRDAIRKEFPDHNIYSEEGDDANTNSEFSWVVDPLDGTIPYTFGISDHFSINIALVKGRVPILGVTHAPKRNELYVSEENRGAFCNDSRLQVSSVDNINHAVIGVDYGKFQRTEILDFHEKLLSKNGVTYPVSYGCASLSLALVASGKLHGYLSLNLEPWDMAAGVLHNREAGGKVTTISGNEWELGDNSVLVANPALHEKLLELFRS